MSTVNEYVEYIFIQVQSYNFISAEKTRFQPKRNASKQFDEMAIPSEILEWVVHRNYVIKTKVKSKPKEHPGKHE